MSGDCVGECVVRVNKWDSLYIILVTMPSSINFMLSPVMFPADAFLIFLRFLYVCREGFSGVRGENCFGS